VSKWKQSAGTENKNRLILPPIKLEVLDGLNSGEQVVISGQLES
jgi:hypothetical protein